METDHPSHAWRYATVLLAALLLCLQLWHVVYGPIWLDDSFYGSVAKNLAGGNGYDAVLYDKIYPFHYSITAGPVIIVPAALLIKLFGNQHWVLGTTQIILIWSLLVGVFITSGKILGQKKWCFSFIALSAALLLTAGDSYNYSIETGDHFALWFYMMGEIPAALLIILGVLIFFGKALTIRRVVIGGFILGMAVLTKTITAIAAVVCMLLVIVKARRNVSSFTSQCLLICAAIIAVILPAALFELIKLLSMGEQGYLLMQAENIQYYKHAAMITGKQSDGHMEVESDMVFQFISMLSLAGIFTTFCILGLIIYSIPRIYKQFLPVKNPDNDEPVIPFLGGAFFLCFLAQFAWWMLFAQPGYERYIVTGLVYFSAGLAFMFLYLCDNEKLRQFFLLFAIAICVENIENLKFLFYEGFKPNTKLQEQLAIADKLALMEAQHIDLFSCSSDYRMEYLMPGFGHLRDCSELVGHDFAQPAALFMFSVAPNRTYRQSANGRYYLGIEPFPPEVLALCKNEIMHSGRMSLRLCAHSTSGK